MKVKPYGPLIRGTTPIAVGDAGSGVRFGVSDSWLLSCAGVNVSFYNTANNTNIFIRSTLMIIQFVDIYVP